MCFLRNPSEYTSVSPCLVRYPLVEIRSCLAHVCKKSKTVHIIISTIQVAKFCAIGQANRALVASETHSRASFFWMPAWVSDEQYTVPEGLAQSCLKCDKSEG